MNNKMRGGNSLLLIISLCSWTLVLLYGFSHVTAVTFDREAKIASLQSGRRTQEETAQENNPQEEEEEPYPRQYELWEPSRISETLLRWKDQFPHLVRVTTSQEAYGLPRSGNEYDCPHDEGGAGCLHYILTLQDFIAHPSNSTSSSRLPEIFLSGEVHGNERVGPTAVMEALHLLLEAADCEAKLFEDARNFEENEKKMSTEASLDEHICRKSLIDHGISDVHRKWLARLVTTRRVVAIPTANALGYFRNEREEDGIDPNRDFPFDVEDATQCMQTIAGRTINEVFREHLFQLGLTFHGGTEVIGYEWGAPTYLDKNSPDDTAQSQIAHAYSRYGASWGRTKPYDVGDMNDKVYYVRGGMEDWAYAGSFDPDRVIECTPRTYDPYPPEKTKYNNSTLRTFNMLIETSHRKIPSTSALGSSKDVLSKDTSQNGHVSRNVRLSLAAIDLVEPYVSIVGVNNVQLSRDVVPLTERTCATAAKAFQVSKQESKIVIEWTVGGALTVDSTQLWYAVNLPEHELDCLSQPSIHHMEGRFKKFSMKGAMTFGSGYFGPQGPKPSANGNQLLGPLFSAQVDISQFKHKDKVTIIASSRVDSNWQKLPNNESPNLPPQSHVVNARTNPNWNHKSAGKEIRGRLDWFSTPITIVFSKKGSATVEIPPSSVGGTPTKGPTALKGLSMRDLLVGFFGAIAVGVLGVLLWSRRARGRHHAKMMAVNDLFDEEGVFTAGGRNVEMAEFNDESYRQY